MVSTLKSFSNFVIKFAKPIVVIWAFLFVLLAYFAISLPSKLEGDGFSYDGDHLRVKEDLSVTFGLPADNIYVVFENQSTEQIKSILNEISVIEEIDNIVSPLDNSSMVNGEYQYAQLDFDYTTKNYPEIVKNIRAITDEINGVTLTGGPVISNDINAASQKDLIQAEAIGLPIALIVLLLAFGTVVASLLPIIVGAATVVIALGVMTLLGDVVPLSIFVLNIVPMLGLALSIDFALLFINRYREERLNHTIEESVKTAIQTAGRSIIFSAICVMIGLGAMVVIQVEIFQNIALGGSLVVALAVVSGLTLLPATIYLLGDRLNKWRLIRVKPTSGRWNRFASFVIKHPVKVIVAALVLFAIALIPIRDIELTIPSTDALPPSYESRAAFETLSEQFGIGDKAAVFLLAERDGGWENTEGLEKIVDIQNKIADMSLVEEVITPFTAANIESVEQWQGIEAQAPGALDEAKQAFIKDKKMYMVVNLNTGSASSEAQQFVRDLDEEDFGVEFGLAGMPKFNQEIFDEISSKIGIAIAIIVVTTFIILMIAFKSILIPVKAILMNVLGLASTFGLLVYIFQYGHFGLQEGTIVLIIPVLVFCLVFGLSMDYEVFLISRIQEEYEKGSSNTKATIDGLVSTSKIITSAALIMIVLTGAFAFTDVIPVKQIGVGIAIAVAIDATIIRLMLVPSLMKLFGDWNWWLPFRKRT